jgi:hypothetical protein
MTLRNLAVFFFLLLAMFTAGAQNASRTIRFSTQEQLQQ